MKKGRIDIVTLGCSKNLVDSERLQSLFWRRGYECHIDAPEAKGDTVVINTCGFIGDAKEESINTMLEFAEARRRGSIARLYVMGCLSQRYLDELQREIPEVDRYYGKFDWNGLADALPVAGDDVTRLYDRDGPSHYRYVKISEGCDRHCAYCAIPLITGRHISRPMEVILDEVREMVSEGTREFQVIAQELTYYGIDLYGQRRIADLISRMADIKGVEWIRLHYAYPSQFPMELLRVMREKDNVCRYMDIALQHVSTPVLRRMRRNSTREETMEIVSRLRQEVPGIALRTTLMVGFPGETDEEFDELLDFVRWARFERMGAFAYSEEEGTYSAEHYRDDVPEEVKQQRLDRLMRVQQRISAELMADMTGKTFKVIIDRREGEWFVGRTEFSSPEVDPEVLLPIDENLAVGQFYDVVITGSEDFDLYAKTLR